MSTLLSNVVALLIVHGIIGILVNRHSLTQKIEVEIRSNILHSISTSICIRKCNKNWG